MWSPRRLGAAASCADPWSGELQDGGLGAEAAGAGRRAQRRRRARQARSGTHIPTDIARPQYKERDEIYLSAGEACVCYICIYMAGVLALPSELSLHTLTYFSARCVLDPMGGLGALGACLVAARQQQLDRAQGAVSREL